MMLDFIKLVLVCINLMLTGVLLYQVYLLRSVCPVKRKATSVPVSLEDIVYNELVFVRGIVPTEETLEAEMRAYEDYLNDVSQEVEDEFDDYDM